MSTPRIVTRAEWSARAPKSAPVKVAISARTATCVHHDGKYPVTLRTFAEACAKVRADQNYHMDGDGWNDIGYNYLVVSAPGYPDIDGLIFEGRGRDVVGAHCLGWNTPWIGVQVATGGDQVASPAALASVKWLHVGFVAGAQHALDQVGHKDGFNTVCPGPQLYAWVHAGMPVPTIKEIFMALTDAQQAQLLADVSDIRDRLFGIYPQRFMTVTDGVATSVPATTAGAVPARGLDQLDGNVLLRTQPDPAAIAKAVVALLPAGGATAAQIAKAVNDDAAKRLVT